jgi:hypothetical protein
MKKEITFKLTEKDEAELGRKAAKLNITYGQFTGVKKEYTGRLEAIELEVNQISKWFEDGERREVVEVIERKNFEKRIMQYLFKGKIVETRDMTAEEMQTELPIEPLKTQKKVQVRNPANGEVTEVIKAETNRKTKKTPLDSPVAN